MVRRFEILFRIVGEDLFDLISQNSEQGIATANSALALIESLRQEVYANMLSYEAKTNYANELSEINKNDILELEFMTQAICIN
jgi:hypothetical protein